MRHFLFAALTAGMLAAGSSPARADDAPDIPPMARKVKGFDLKLLDPVDGVTLKQVGEASYLFTLNSEAPDLDARIEARLHLTKAQLDKAQKVFTDRMTADKTFTITNLFGAYGSEVAEGRYAAYGRDVAQSVLNGTPLAEPEPMSEEKFDLIRGYYSRKEATAGTKFSDLDKMLAPIGLTFNDYQILSSWYGRRLGLQADADDGGSPPGASDPVADATPPARPRPELGGLWRLRWTLLRRGDAGMEKVPQSRDVCLKLNMTAADLPIMPKPDGSKCAMGVSSFYATGISLSANCDHGDYSVQWSFDLQPPQGGPDAKPPPGGLEAKPPQAPWTGELQYLVQNELLGDRAPSASTPMTGERLGDCP